MMLIQLPVFFGTHFTSQLQLSIPVNSECSGLINCVLCLLSCIMVAAGELLERFFFYCILRFKSGILVNAFTYYVQISPVNAVFVIRTKCSVGLGYKIEQQNVFKGSIATSLPNAEIQHAQQLAIWFLFEHLLLAASWLCDILLIQICYQPDRNLLSVPIRDKLHASLISI